MENYFHNYNAEWVLYILGVTICLSFSKASKAFLTDEAIRLIGGWAYGTITKIQSKRDLTKILYKTTYFTLRGHTIILPSIWRVLLVSIFTTVISISFFSHLTILKTEETFWAFSEPENITASSFAIYLVKALYFIGIPFPYIISNYLLDYISVFIVITLFSNIKYSFLRLLAVFLFYPVLYLIIAFLTSVLMAYLFGAFFPAFNLLKDETLDLVIIIAGLGLRELLFNDITNYCQNTVVCLDPYDPFLGFLQIIPAWSVICLMSGFFSLIVSFATLKNQFFEKNIQRIRAIIISLHRMFSAAGYVENPRMYLTLISILTWTIIFSFYILLIIFLRTIF